MKCLRCYGQPDKEAKFISCLTKMRVCDADDEEDSKPGVNLQGALLVQELLQFNKPMTERKRIYVNKTTELLTQHVENLEQQIFEIRREIRIRD